MSLSQVVAKVAAAQESHQRELYELHQRGIRSETEQPRRAAPYHPSEAFRSLYWGACASSGLYYEQRYGLLRAALVEARHVLAAHPVLADLVDPMDSKADFVIRINSGGGPGTLSGLVAGQIARAIEVGDSGFEMAATELNALLEPLDAQPPTRAFSDLSTGYHVVPLYGLRIGDETTFTGETAIVPFGKLEAFVNRGVIGDLVPKVINYGTWNAVGAIVKPFRWKPQFLKANDRSEPGLDWGGSFLEDAEAFTELLALFHAAPVIALATIPYCIHRTAAHLLGQAHYHTGYGWGPSVRDFDVLSGSSPLSQDALDAAKKAFRHRNRDGNRDYEPVIARLAEALARSGRFQADDKILDVAIALERMYELDGAELSFKLKTRAACFLETDTYRRLQVYRDVGKLYQARSGIVHRKRKSSSAQAKADAFDKGFGVARRTVVKLLQDGPPSDWNAMVIGAIDHHSDKHRTAAGTIDPGYRNRNDQVVLRRTDLLGNDQNEGVYVLECSRCQHRYGTSGSVIWRRRCPDCGGGRPGLNIGEV